MTWLRIRVINRTGRVLDVWTNKFIAFEVPLDSVRRIYGDQYEIVVQDPEQTDDLRVLDSDGQRVLQNIQFSELGQPILYEEESSGTLPDHRTANI